MHKPASFISRFLYLLFFLELLFMHCIISLLGGEFINRFLLQTKIISKPSEIIETIFLLMYILLLFGGIFYLRRRKISVYGLFGLGLRSHGSHPLTKKRRVARGLVELLLIVLSPFISTLIFIPCAIGLTYLLNYLPDSNVFAYKISDIPVILYVLLLVYLLLVLLTNVVLLVSFWKRRGLQDILTNTVVISDGKGWAYSRLACFIGAMLLLLFVMLYGVSFLDRNLVTISDPSQRVISLSSMSAYSNPSLGFFIVYPTDHFSPQQQVDTRNGNETVLPHILFQGKKGSNSLCIQKFSVVKMTNVTGFEVVDGKFVRHFDGDIFPEYLNFFEIQQYQDVVFGSAVGTVEIGGRSATKVIYNPPYEKKKRVFMYFIPGNTDMYEIAYELYDHEYTLSGNWVPFSPEQCRQNQEAIEKIISTFHIV